MNDKSVKGEFQATSRGSILSSIEQKHVRYIGMADRRAQGLLTITAFLIPLSLTRIETEECQIGVLLYLGSSMVTVVAAILCLAPKRYETSSTSDPYLLHFSGISRLKEDEYLKRMALLTSNLDSLTHEVSRELYHISNDVLIPKFRLLRVAYFSFLFGLVGSTAFVVHGYFH